MVTLFGLGTLPHSYLPPCLSAPSSQKVFFNVALSTRPWAHPSLVPTAFTEHLMHCFRLLMTTRQESPTSVLHQHRTTRPLKQMLPTPCQGLCKPPATLPSALTHQIGSEEMWESKCFCSEERELSLKGLLKRSQQIKLVFPCSPRVCVETSAREHKRYTGPPLCALWMFELFSPSTCNYARKSSKDRKINVLSVLITIKPQLSH